VKAGIVSQARMGSTRLPGKVLLHAGGKPLLQWHLERLRQSGLGVYVATTAARSDEAIVRLCEALGVPTHRGSEEDVLARYLGLVEAERLDLVVRVTADCPLIDGALIAEAMRAYIAGPPAWNTYLTNCQKRTYPRGFDFEIMSAKALRLAGEQATRAYEREHVTPFIWSTRPELFDIRHWTRASDASRFRITVDEPADLEAIRVLVEDFGAGALPAEDIIAALEKNPRIAAINQAVSQKDFRGGDARVPDRR